MSILEGASNFVINNSLHVDASRRSLNIGESCCPTCGSWLDTDNDDEGWRSLTEASLFDATYDSAAHENMEPPLPATRHAGLIDELDDLVSGGEPSFRALVFSAPKSNLAHLCAKRLDDNLCASFFVSQLLHTDDHVRFFPTIAYQLSRKFPAYSNLLEKELRRDPSILHKTLEVQFKKLIADRFRELLSEGHDFGPRKVVVINGLEEYGKVQIRLKILTTILRRAGELPFVWLIFGQHDSALDRQLIEVGAIAGICWARDHRTLKSRTHPTRGF